MARKVWKTTLKGERRADEVMEAVGGHGGELVRIHVEGGETQVFFEADEEGARGAGKALGHEASASDEKEAMRIG